MAQGDVWYGGEIREWPFVDGAVGWHFVDQEARIGMDGRVTAFRIYAKRQNALELVIYRKAGGAFSVVGRSQAVTPASLGAQEFALAAPIDVKAGDLVGWHDYQDGVIAYTYTGPDAENHLNSRVAFNDGTTPTGFTRSSWRYYAIQVVVQAAVQEAKVSVSAKQPWVDTGLDLKAGAALTITATGQWTNGGSPAYYGDADGFKGVLYPKAVLPTANFIALIGKVGDQVFFVGKSFQGASPGTGRLSLQINEEPNAECFADNDGAMNVEIRQQ